jgi:hypothetical protein
MQVTRSSTPDGVIRTIAGQRPDQQERTGRRRHPGARRLARIATVDQVQRRAVLSLAGGRFSVVPARIPSGPWTGSLNGHLDSLGPIAVDARGDIDVSGLNGWAIW